MATQHREMIEVTCITTSPWRAVLEDSFTRFLEGWGWQVTHLRDGNKDIFIGIEKVRP